MHTHFPSAPDSIAILTSGQNLDHEDRYVMQIASTPPARGSAHPLVSNHPLKMAPRRTVRWASPGPVPNPESPAVPAALQVHALPPAAAPTAHRTPCMQPPSSDVARASNTPAYDPLSGWTLPHDDPWRQILRMRQALKDTTTPQVSLEHSLPVPNCLPLTTRSLFARAGACRSEPGPLTS